MQKNTSFTKTYWIGMLHLMIPRTSNFETMFFQNIFISLSWSRYFLKVPCEMKEWIERADLFVCKQWASSGNVFVILKTTKVCSLLWLWRRERNLQTIPREFWRSMRVLWVSFTTPCREIQWIGHQKHS